METKDVLSARVREGNCLTADTWACPDGSLLKTILKHGTGVDKPKEGSTCRLLAEVDMEQDMAAQQPLHFPLNEWAEVVLGDGDTPWGSAVDKCLETMLEGEKCSVRVAPHCSSLGTLPELLFIMQLAAFSPAPDSWEMDFNEKWALALHDKSMGTTHFQAGNLFGATHRYGRALRLLLSVAHCELPATIEGDYGCAKAALHTNLAACQLRLHQFENAVQNCTKALVQESNSVKALYRRGTAYGALNEFERAGADLQEVLRLEPGNRAAQRELKHQADRAREQEAKMAHAMHKLFL
ncbi:FK506-binding protein-like [Ambystoma mexicanum]|uniref:FK506-binding protein-like n=1 Tax=Ambystoma mexicanum TaxID=8296 RepID=UPI0037E74440